MAKCIECGKQIRYETRFEKIVASDETVHLLVNEIVRTGWRMIAASKENSVHEVWFEREVKE